MLGRATCLQLYIWPMAVTLNSTRSRYIVQYSPPAMSKYPLENINITEADIGSGRRERPPRSILILVTRYRQVMASIHPDRRRIKHQGLNLVL